MYFSSMLSVVFLGFGNVNRHLCEAFFSSEEIKVLQIYNRSHNELASNFNSIEFTHEISKIKMADVYIIGIADDAISSFSETLPFKDRLVAHTSGSVSMDSLSNTNRKGVFYPLQTFSKSRKVDFSEIPICIEAEKEPDLKILQELGGIISEKVVKISSEERKKIHLAAVFVNNFVNHLYQISEEILKKESLPFELLKPLIKETAAKLDTLSPIEAQTGPAKRNDLKTIENHLHLLTEETYKNLYEQLTKSIQNAQR